MTQAHLLHGVGDAQRLRAVDQVRHPRLHVAEPAAARADVAEDHEGGGAALPAFADVRAVGLLADGVEGLRAHQALDAPVARAARGLDLQPRRLARPERHHVVCLRGSPRLRPGARDVQARVGHAASSIPISSPHVGDPERLAAVRDAELAAHDVHEPVHVEGRAELARDGRHAAVLDAAGNDPLERLQVVVHVDREAVRRHAAAHVHADRGDLARLVRPHPGQAVDRPGLDAHVGERGDDRCLHAAHVLVHVVAVGPQAHDRIADQLPGAVIGDPAAPVGLGDVDALGAVPLLAHRQLARLHASPPRVDRRVLEQQQHVGHGARLPRLLQPLLHLERLPVGDQAAAVAPDLSHRRTIVPGAPSRHPGSAPRRPRRGPGDRTTGTG